MRNVTNRTVHRGIKHDTVRIAVPAILAGTLVALMSTAAQAQATRTWVSGVGDDINPCSRTAPCKTFATAMSKTAVNGEINCLDPGGFGTVNVVKSITIDCHDMVGSALNASTTAFIVNFDNFSADVRKTVRIRNINMQGADSGTGGVRIIGSVAGGVVVVEDALIDGNFGGNARGISDERAVAGELHVINTTVRNNGGVGIAVVPSAGTSGVFATLVNVRVLNNGSNGVSLNGGSQGYLKDVVASGNGNVGFDISTGSDATIVSSAAVKNTNHGLFTSGGTARVANSTFAYNGSQNTGAWISFGNNVVVGAATTAPTAAGPASTDLGQK